MVSSRRRTSERASVDSIILQISGVDITTGSDAVDRLSALQIQTQTYRDVRESTQLRPKDKQSHPPLTVENLKALELSHQRASAAEDAYIFRNNSSIKHIRCPRTLNWLSRGPTALRRYLQDLENMLDPYTPYRIPADDLAGIGTEERIGKAINRIDQTTSQMIMDFEGHLLTLGDEEDDLSLGRLNIRATNQFVGYAAGEYDVAAWGRWESFQ